MIDRQAFINKAVEGMAKQDFALSWAEEFSYPMYRNDNGTRCVIGATMPDEVYHPGFEDKAVQDVVSLLSEEEIRTWFGVDSLTSEDFRFLCDLQLVHDLAKSPENFKYRLQNFIQSYSLEMPEVLKEV